MGNHYTWIYTFAGNFLWAGPGAIEVTLLPGAQYNRFEDFIQKEVKKGYRCVQYRDMHYKWRKPTNPMSIEDFHKAILRSPKIETYRPALAFFKWAKSMNCIKFMEFGFTLLGVGYTDEKYVLGDDVSEVYINTKKENDQRQKYKKWMGERITVKLVEYGQEANSSSYESLNEVELNIGWLYSVRPSVTFKDLRETLETFYKGEYYFDLFCAKGNLYPLDLKETLSSLGNCITHDELSRWNKLKPDGKYAILYYRETDMPIPDSEESSSSEPLESSDDEQGGLWKWAKSFFR